MEVRVPDNHTDDATVCIGSCPAASASVNSSGAGCSNTNEEFCLTENVSANVTCSQTTTEADVYICPCSWNCTSSPCSIPGTCNLTNDSVDLTGGTAVCVNLGADPAGGGPMKCYDIVLDCGGDGYYNSTDARDELGVSCGGG